MLTKVRSIVQHPILLAAALATAVSAGLASAASAGIIYQDNFTGSTALGTLNGSAPTVDNGNSATWTSYATGSGSAARGWSDSGYSMAGANSGREEAYLLFTPVSGQIYTLSAGLETTGEPGNFAGYPDGNYWAALGFMTTPSTTTSFDSSGASPYVINRYNGSGGSAIEGPGTSGGYVNFSNTPGLNSYSVVLNTTASAWTYQMYLTNSSVTNSLVASGTFASNPVITAVGIENLIGFATVSNFSLTSAAVPEPTTLAAFGLGGLGLLLMGRRRKSV